MSMMDDFDLEDVEFEDEPGPEESSNRTFLVVAGILGGILILAMVFVAIYAMVILPRSRDARATQDAEIYAQNTEVAMWAAMTAEAESWTATPSATSTRAPSTATPVIAPTNTPVVEKVMPTQDPRTATVAALLTQQVANLTLTPVAELPDTGFGDNVGVTELIAIAAALVLVIFFARRFRSAT
jgi:cytoskeletal protein RodZ